MLVLTRKVGEQIVIDGGRIVITVQAVRGGRVSLAVDADRRISVKRAEVTSPEDSKPVKA